MGYIKEQAKLLSGAQGLQWSVSITSGPRKENSEPVTGSWVVKAH